VLLVLYSVCGVLLGFIVGYQYAWEKRSLLQFGKQIDNWTFIRRLLSG